MDSNKTYAKVGRKVIGHLGLEGQRRQFADGSYMIWFRDIRAIDRDWLAHPEETMAAIGGVLLSHTEAYEEQQGIVCRPLPVPADPRFVDDEPGEAEDADAETEEIDDAGSEEDAGTENIDGDNDTDAGSTEEDAEPGTAAPEEGGES